MTWLIALIIAIISAVLLHSVLMVFSRSHAVVNFVGIGTACGVGLLMYLVSSSEPLISRVAALSAYATFCEFYIFSFTLAGISVSSKILVTLLDGPSSASAIQEKYSTSGMVQSRLERLLKTRLIEGSVPEPRLSPRGRLIVRVFLVLKRFFHHL